MRSHPSFPLTNAIREFAEAPRGSVRAAQESPLSAERKRWSPLMKTHTTPLPAAAICAVVGSGIGVPVGTADAVTLGVGVGVDALVAVGLGLELGVGVDAAGAHADRTKAMNRKSCFFTPHPL